MTNTIFSLLDQGELLQLALTASGANEGGAAIGYLKEAISRPDASATAHYLLGAEYAQIRMYDRAIAELESALALDPSLSTARLQLGLLWLTSGRGDKASAVLDGLAGLAQDDPLRYFGVGLCHLIRDEFVAARDMLLQGIARNTGNAPLNGDMQRIVGEIEALEQGQAPAPVPAPAEPEPAESVADARHIFLSAYTGKTSH